MWVNVNDLAKRTFLHEKRLRLGDDRNNLGYSFARSRRYHLSNAAMSRVRRYRLHADRGAMRDNRALIPSPQAIFKGHNEAAVLLRSVLEAYS